LLLSAYLPLNKVLTLPTQLEFTLNNKNIHWPYYLSLESDVDKLSRYIEFTEDNYSTYSVELVRIFLSICSEVDVVMKELCAITSPNSSASNIGAYKKIIKT